MMKVTYSVPAKPFAEWLKSRSTKYNDVKEFASHVGVEYTWMLKLINGQFKKVEVDKVDRIICKDDTIHIRDLYPELYEEI